MAACKGDGDDDDEDRIPNGGMALDLTSDIGDLNTRDTSELSADCQPSSVAAPIVETVTKTTTTEVVTAAAPAEERQETKPTQIPDT